MSGSPLDFEEDTYSRIFSALKHPFRRKILSMLKETPLTYTDILNGLGVETGLLNYHLENLSGLISKDKDGRYTLSAFGKAATDLTTRVEMPFKERVRTIRLFGLKIKTVYIALAIVAALFFSNVYLAYAYSELSKERANAFGETLIQTRGFLLEAVRILNITISDGRIDFLMLDTLYRDLIQLSRQFKTVMTLDADHREYWSQIKEATDSLTEFNKDLNNKIMRYKDYIAIDFAQRLHIETDIENIRDDLSDIEKYAFPKEIIIGSSPRVEIIESMIAKAAEAANKLNIDVESARRSFSSAESLLSAQARVEVDRLLVTTENYINLVITNDGNSNLEFSVEYYFDKLIDGNWVSVPSETAWNMTLLSLKPGESYSLKMNIIGLDSGKYRALKELQVEGTKACQTFYPEFRVERPVDDDPNTMPRWGVKMSCWVAEESMESPDYPVMELINEGARKLIMDPEYNIEKLESGRWEPAWTYQPAVLVKTVVGWGETYKQILKVPQLIPGRYRVTKDIGIEGTNVKKQLQIEFDIH